MKKLLSLILVLIISLSVLPTLVACGEEEPEYSEEYVFNDSHHWKPQINGDGEPIEYEEHYNPKLGKGVGKCKCGYYFPCHNLKYRLKTINGVTGYEVYDYDEDMSPNFYHVEVPKFYQGEEDLEPIPVISIARYALSNRPHTATATYGQCDIRIRSIKLNEGLLNVGDGAVCYSDIEEITIPNSVVGDLHYTFMQCTALKKIVVGNGITDIQGYTFYGLPVCETIILGNSIREIRTRTFIDCGALRTVVLPASLVSMPEGSHAGNTGVCEPQTVIFSGNKINLFYQITREELEARTIPLFPRNAEGSLLNPDGTVAHLVKFENNNFDQKSFTTYGLNENWHGQNNVYCLGEWYFDEKGNALVA